MTKNTNKSGSTEKNAETVEVKDLQEQIQKLQDEKKDLEAKIEDLSQKASEVKDLQEQIANLESEIKTLAEAGIQDEKPAQGTVKIASRVSSGFRRCGKRFTAKPQTFDVSDFTEEELKILEAEPHLVVVQA